MDRTGSPQNIFHSSSIHWTAHHGTYFRTAAYTGHLSTEHISQQQYIHDIKDRTALHRTYFTTAAYTEHKGTGQLSTEHIEQQQQIQDSSPQNIFHNSSIYRT
jgi:hypothetical protein